MISLKLAFRSVSRRGWGLLSIVVPSALLFAMLTFLVSTELTVRQLLSSGIAPRAIRLGTVEGYPWETSAFTKPEVNQLAAIPGVTVAPGTFTRCFLTENEPVEFNCGATNRTYVQIWEMDMPVSEADLDRWDAVKNGAIMSRALASKHHWKVGDDITLYLPWKEHGKQVSLDLQITSIADKYIDPTTVYYHLEYIEQRLGRPFSSWVVWMLIDHAERRQAVMDNVDAKLNETNRPHLLWRMEDTTQGILAGSTVLRESFRIAGGFAFLLIVCISVTILIVSIEQRTTELAALLAIGFRRRVLAISILIEGALLLLPAALLGAACVWIPFHDSPIMFDAIFRVKVPLAAAIATTVGGTLLGIVAALIPAWRVQRLDALASLR